LLESGCAFSTSALKIFVLGVKEWYTKDNDLPIEYNKRYTHFKKQIVT